MAMPIICWKTFPVKTMKRLSTRISSIFIMSSSVYLLFESVNRVPRYMYLNPNIGISDFYFFCRKTGVKQNLHVACTTFVCKKKRAHHDIKSFFSTTCHTLFCRTRRGQTIHKQCFTICSFLYIFFEEIAKVCLVPVLVLFVQCNYKYCVGPYTKSDIYIYTYIYIYMLYVMQAFVIGASVYILFQGVY